MTPEDKPPYATAANDAAAAPPPPKPPVGGVPQPPTVKGVKDQIDAWVYPALACTVRGAAATLNTVPPGMILVSACRMMGTLVGHMLGGTLVDILTARKLCQEAFMEGLKNNPPNAAVILGDPAKPKKNGHAG